MNSTHKPVSIQRLGSLKKSLARALLAGAFGLAVMGLGAGIATADPPPTAGGFNQPGAASDSIAQPNPGDLSEMEQLQIQTAQQQYDQATQIASNVAKEEAGTGGEIIQNLKP